jgi:hypothetical protein
MTIYDLVARSRQGVELGRTAVKAASDADAVSWADSHVLHLGTDVYVFETSAKPPVVGRSREHLRLVAIRYPAKLWEQ